MAGDREVTDARSLVDARLSGSSHRCRWRSLCVGSLALITAKGGKAHRMWGRTYFWCMAIVAFTALVMAAYRPVLFLALVAIFSFYASFSAYRVLGQKSAWKGDPVVRRLDWVAAIFCFAASLTLAVLGAVRPNSCRTYASRRLSSDSLGCVFRADPSGASRIHPRRECFGGMRICRE